MTSPARPWDATNGAAGGAGHDELLHRIARLEQRLAMNSADADRTTDRLEVELRLAAELPSLDTAAFAAAQRQRLGALEHARAAVVAELTELKRQMPGAFVSPAKPE